MRKKIFRKKIFNMIITAACWSFAVCGCQKAPKRSANGDILHAKNAMEDEVAAIVGAGAEEAAGTGAETGTAGAGTKAGTQKGSKEIDCFLGTAENGIRIKAAMPYIPAHVYHMVLKENSTLDMERLEAFLGSGSGKIYDLSQERKKEDEKLEKENENSTERVRYSVFGGDSFCVISDGEKEAGFSHGTSAYYTDEGLMEKCRSIYKSTEETVLAGTGFTDAAAQSPDFSAKEAEALLLDKLADIGAAEIFIYEITMYQSEDFLFYEMKFTPSYDGMGSVHELGDVSCGQIYPYGAAWVCGDGIASLNLDTCLGRVNQKEKCEELLSWEQIEKILEVNLNNGKLHGSNKVIMSNVEFLYYPVFKENENALELVPVWQIYIPLSAWAETEELSDEIVMNDAAWSVFVNAVSGEIVRINE